MKMLGHELLLFLLACGAPVSAGHNLDYEDLVARLTDLEELAVLPVSGERCGQWSSYDRRSRYDESTGAYLHWSANGDGTGFIRQEGDRQVLAEMDGPGVIWRIWSALPEKGHVTIYLDGRERPAVDLPFEGYFNHANPPFDRPALVHTTAGGRNCYVPIPYQKSCRILAEPNWGRYYQFTYSTLPEGTRLPTFRRDLPATALAALDRADKALRNCGSDPATERKQEVAEKAAPALSPGQTVTLADLSGPAAITAFRFAMALPEPPRDGLALRELVLRIYWDGRTEPCVAAPVGDFFGAAPGAPRYRSLPMGMTESGFYSFWYMPFGKRALVQLSNEGPEQRVVHCEIRHAPLNRPIDSLGRFHARWHPDEDADPARPIDWTMLKTRGRGRFCGVMLHIWNLRGGWWGEGDEKFFVDGERFPSTFGTGSEDYFGYAWCSEKLFEHAFHNQTVSVPRNGCANPSAEDSGGHISNNRWQIADNIPFLQSFEGAIEKYFPNSDFTRYACVAYWYQAEPHAPRGPIAPLADRVRGIHDRESLLLRFLREAKQHAAGRPIEPLRADYEILVSDPGIADYRIRLALRMARAEKAAGHAGRARALLEPFMQTLVVPFASRDYAEDILEVMGTAASRPNAHRPLLVENEDGSVQRDKRDGVWCVRTQSARGRPHIYFSLPDKSGLRKQEQTLVMRITCNSRGEPGCSLVVQYDSAWSNNLAGHYRPSARVAVPETPGWHTLVVRCPRARLSGHQNNRADFRIAVAGGDVWVSDVEVERED